MSCRTRRCSPAPDDDDRRQFLLQHRSRHIGVLHGERAAEAAALLRVRKIDQFDPGHGPKEPERRVSDPQQPQRVARRVVCDRALVRRADVFDAQDAREELRELPRLAWHAAVVSARADRACARAPARRTSPTVSPPRHRARRSRRTAGRAASPPPGIPSSRASGRNTSARAERQPRSRAARARSRSPCRPPGTACRRGT